jgi:rubredoxin---NAD+ reductase
MWNLIKSLLKPSDPNSYKRWQCLACNYIYDEAKGWPDDGIAAGTRWQDIPEDWVCPECSAAKSDFEMIRIG